MKPREGRAEVMATRWLTPEIVEVDLRVVDPEDWSFEAGQWVSVPFGPKIVRAYSMASPPSRDRLVSLSIDVAPDGIGSRWARELEPGAAVRFKGPTGGFIANRADPRPTLFVAEEIGAVPIRSILLDLYRTGYGRPNALVYWARRRDGLVYDGDFRALARRYPSFAYRPALREGTPEWAGEVGEAHEIVAGLPELAGCGVGRGPGLLAYVCGGGDTINRVREVLMGKGMDRKSVKWEKFW